MSKQDLTLAERITLFVGCEVMRYIYKVPQPELWMTHMPELLKEDSGLSVTYKVEFPSYPRFTTHVIQIELHGNGTLWTGGHIHALFLGFGIGQNEIDFGVTRKESGEPIVTIQW